MAKKAKRTWDEFESFIVQVFMGYPLDRQVRELQRHGYFDREDVDCANYICYLWDKESADNERKLRAEHLLCRQIKHKLVNIAIAAEGLPPIWADIHNVLKACAYYDAKFVCPLCGSKFTNELVSFDDWCPICAVGLEAVENVGFLVTPDETL